MWLLFGALGFLVGQVLGAIFAVVAAAADGKLHNLNAIASLSEPPTWYIVSTLVGLWAGFLAGPWLASTVRGTRSLVRDLGLRFKWIDLVGIPIGIGGQFVVAAIYIPISQHVNDFNSKFNAPSQKLTGGSHGLGFAIIAVLTVVGAPFFEEVFFRGLLLRSFARLFGNLGRWVGPALAIVITGSSLGWPMPNRCSWWGWPPSGHPVVRFLPDRPTGHEHGLARHLQPGRGAATLAAGTGVIF